MALTSLFYTLTLTPTTPPWQEVNAFSFFIPSNPFFPIKELAAHPGIEPCPLDFEQHSPDHFKTVAINESLYLFILPNPFLPLWNQQPKSAVVQPGIDLWRKEND